MDFVWKTCLNEGFFPLVYDLVEYMGLEGENSSRCRQVSGGEGESSKGSAKVRRSTEKSEGSKDVHQDPSQDPPEDGSQDGFQAPPQGPSEPLSTLPLDVEEKKVLVVSIIPLQGYLSHGPGGQEIHMAMNYIRQQLCMSSNLCLKWMEAIGR